MTKKQIELMSQVELKEAIRENYLDMLPAVDLLQSLLIGKITPVEEVNDLNRRLTGALGKIQEIRRFFRNRYGEELPDPLGLDVKTDKLL